MTGLRCIALMLALGAGSSPALAQTASPMPAPQTTLPHTTLTAGMYRIDVQLATTPEEREIGLMYRKSMPEYEGMLFVFNRPGVQCFWMKNTLIPLTAAFIADDGTIVNLADMQPQTETNHCSAEPVRFVLEMNQGWFSQKHVLAGSRLGGSPFVPQQ